MSLPQFDVLQPQSVEEACTLLKNHHKDGAAILAGGTDILVDIRIPIIPEHLPRCKGCDPAKGKPQRAVEKPPAYLIALSHIPELRGIHQAENGDIFFGAMTSISEICESRLVRDKLTALAQGGDDLGSPLVRNRGTIGGNICNARPAADALLPSMALGAQLEISSAKGKSTIPIEDFVTGPGRTILKTGEILTKVTFPKLPPHTGSSFIKLANRKALEISVVNVASVITLDSAGKIANARISMGAVAPKPILAPKTAIFLIGKEPSDKIFTEAGKIAATECKPISDHRGSKPYRIDMIDVLVRRTLEGAVRGIR